MDEVAVENEVIKMDVCLLLVIDNDVVAYEAFEVNMCLQTGCGGQ